MPQKWIQAPVSITWQNVCKKQTPQKKTDSILGVLLCIIGSGGWI
jgi:hypothetical protein